MDSRQGDSERILLGDVCEVGHGPPAAEDDRRGALTVPRRARTSSREAAHYRDFLQVSKEHVEAIIRLPESKRRGPRGGVAVPFPERLHAMLKAAGDEDSGDVASWHSHGRAFSINQPEQFVESMLPRFFRQNKLASFQRQLNLYGFRRLASASGTEGSSYYHELFLRSRPDLCKLLMRHMQQPSERTTHVQNLSDPDLLAFPPSLATSLCATKPTKDHQPGLQTHEIDALQTLHSCSLANHQECEESTFRASAETSSAAKGAKISADGRIDASIVLPAIKRNGRRGGVVVPFPERLYEMLKTAEDEDATDIVSWHSNGRAFSIHQPKRFAEEMLPRFFRHNKLASFQRQLNLYGFRRLAEGVGYCSRMFLRSRPDLCMMMMRRSKSGEACMLAELLPLRDHCQSVSPDKQCQRKPAPPRRNSSVEVSSTSLASSQAGKNKPNATESAADQGVAASATEEPENNELARVQAAPPSHSSVKITEDHPSLQGQSGDEKPLKLSKPVDELWRQSQPEANLPTIDLKALFHQPQMKRGSSGPTPENEHGNLEPNEIPNLSKLRANRPTKHQSNHEQAEQPRSSSLAACGQDEESTLRPEKGTRIAVGCTSLNNIDESQKRSRCEGQLPNVDFSSLFHRYQEQDSRVADLPAQVRERVLSNFGLSDADLQPNQIPNLPETRSDYRPS